MGGRHRGACRPLLCVWPPPLRAPVAPPQRGVSELSALPAEPSLFWWSAEENEALLRFWETYILVLETLEGNQVRVPESLGAAPAR